MTAGRLKLSVAARLLMKGFQMRTSLLLALCIVSVSCMNAPEDAGGASKPYVSMKVREADRKDLLESTAMAQSGRYDEAKAKLAATMIPDVVKISVTGDRLAQEAVEKAVAAWNTALKDSPKLEIVDGSSPAGLAVSFGPVAVDNSNGFAHPGCSGL